MAELQVIQFQEEEEASHLSCSCLTESIYELVRLVIEFRRFILRLEWHPYCNGRV